MFPILMVIGAPAVGKSTTSRALAARFPQSVHISVDNLREMVVSGLVLPGAVWSDDLIQQVTLARDAAAHMALSYQAAGFAVVIDDFWDANHPSDYRALLEQSHVHKILLIPDQHAAHQRNLQRSGDSPARAYIDEGIRLVYQHLEAVVPHLAQSGWVVVDTTVLSIEAAVTEILRLTALDSVVQQAREQS